MFSQAKLQRPPLPTLGSHGPPVSYYKPKENFIKKKETAITIGNDARFDSLKDRNKVAREQVSPVSY